MRDLAEKVAVVTGGASGIGRALVERFAAERMRVVVADVEDAAIRDERFWVRTPPELTAARLRAGAMDIVEGRTPAPPATE